uniref:Uncharacterized protein n=1 Tax=Nelumbo nucifera TaxID=4432 RepID=A0A822XZI0_NELNU|nr:TPA_asm: hypothetical protein HUJ06_028512 [Nelumbo nucifera]
MSSFQVVGLDKSGTPIEGKLNGSLGTGFSFISSLSELDWNWFCNYNCKLVTHG